MIKFGVQLGGGNSRKKIQPIHIELNKIFKGNSDKYFNKIQSFGIYFRVEGPLRCFGDEGPDNLEYLPKHRELGIDFVVPSSIWESDDVEEIRYYLLCAVKNCFHILLDSARKQGFLAEEEVLMKDFNSRIAQLL